MKRTYSDLITILSELPPMGVNNHSNFKSSLTGHYKLRVVKVLDISKPADKPVDEIDEPEDNDVALENQLSKCNARMIQLELKDSKEADIKAIETERIELLTAVKPNSIITIAGPVDVRCRNIMLERKHVLNIENPPKDEPTLVSNIRSATEGETIHVINNVDPLKEEPSLVNTVNPTSHEVINVVDISSQPKETLHLPLVETKPQIQVVQLEEDWDEIEDDCIILD